MKKALSLILAVLMLMGMLSISASADDKVVIEFWNTHGETFGGPAVTKVCANSCIACGMCERACPTNAIEIDKAEGKWTIQRMQCIQCSACVDCCPKNCLTMENLYTIPDVVKVVDSFDIPKKAPKKAKNPAKKSPSRILNQMT